jgi:hypothetical protein
MPFDIWIYLADNSLLVFYRLGNSNNGSLKRSVELFKL